jgi:hypothetical protein
MPSDNVARFRLSVWRPAQIPRPLDYVLREAGEGESGLAFDSGRLQEEIYHWHPSQEDVWGCIEDPSVSNELRDEFIQGFHPMLAPEQRTMAKFKAAVAKLQSQLSAPSATAWADTMQTVAYGREESVNLRANSTLALLHHLRWIARIFGNVPGASVAIR